MTGHAGNGRAATPGGFGRERQTLTAALRQAEEDGRIVDLRAAVEARSTWWVRVAASPPLTTTSAVLLSLILLAVIGFGTAIMVGQAHTDALIVELIQVRGD